MNLITFTPQLDINTCKPQLIKLYRNLGTLLEREAKFGVNTPLELINQIDDHRQAIYLIEQFIAGQISAADLDEALKPLNLAINQGQVVNIGTYIAGDVTVEMVGRDKIINTIDVVIKTAYTAAEEARARQELEYETLAQTVISFSQDLRTRIGQPVDASNPYRGLLEYRLADADFFFGRDQAIGAILERLFNLDNPSRLLILHAESGAGKTSLIQAGVMSRLLAQGGVPLYVRAWRQNPVIALKQLLLPGYGQWPGLAQASLRNFLYQIAKYTTKLQEPYSNHQF